MSLNVIYDLNLEVKTRKQVCFLERELRRSLFEYGPVAGHIKFLYRLDFPGTELAYVGTGLSARIASRLSSKMQEYDNEDLVYHTNEAMDRGRPRTTHCVGLFKVLASWDTGERFECFEKKRCLDAGLTLLNRRGLFELSNYGFVPIEKWLGEERIQRFHELGTAD
ncbi:hypothetical protein [Marinobacterium mangrovicola]|uniref:Uncharacterized protein n=1 Tax=Marinobacterium mangrovicola TaxID=1476959 RepID=A0A4R1GGP0_9GAMM|nr:hypothetical protein [Marinobacterium mangrovicola]TCK05865.1 hypothetical protein CLV83_2804 [Marinobacterium mangrovicola]